MGEEREKDQQRPQNGDIGVFPTRSLPDSPQELGTEIGRYKLLSVLGEGGFGIVYLAEQKHPVRRQVALKVIKPGMDSKQVIARFEAERQALALLDHPNIARVFDAGTTENGRPYFVMEIVKGLPITEYCDQHNLSIEERLELFRQVCGAVQHAHYKGIIHRDLKPSNILVPVRGDRPVPMIIDFGVAKAISQPLTERTLFTEQGQFIGTPEYMSPEQAGITIVDIDTRSDIYSLGIVLYELLTGTLPFSRHELEQAGFAEIQRIIRETDPPRPNTRLSGLGEDATKIAEKRHTEVRALTKRLHNELEWIPLKAMRKDPDRRYTSAAELADDVQNYLNGDPLIAGPESVAYRARKFIRKHAGPIVSVAVILIVLIAGLALSTIMYIRAERLRVASERAEKDTARALYFNSIFLADKELADGDFSRAYELLTSCIESFRRWEWYWLWDRASHPSKTLCSHEDAVRLVIFSADSKRVISASSDNTVRVWDIEGGATFQVANFCEGGDRVHSIALSSDGERVAFGSDGVIKVRRAKPGSEAATLAGHEGPVWTVAFDPNGTRIASGGSDGTVKVWDVKTETPIRMLRGHSSGVWSVAFSWDGRYVVSGSDDNTVRLWDVETGSAIFILQGHEGRVSAVTFSPDGQRIASGSWDRTVKVWNIKTGSQETLYGHDDRVLCIAFSPDGRRIASGSVDKIVRLWDIETGSEVMTLRGHTESVLSVALSPDGKRIASGSWDKTVKLWDASPKLGFRTLRGHQGRVNAVAISLDGRYIASGSWDKTIKLWDVETGDVIRTIPGHADRVSSVAFSPDGERIVSGSWDKTVKVWDRDKGNELLTLPCDDRVVYSVAISPDGKRIAWGSNDKAVKLWDEEAGSQTIALQGHQGEVYAVAFSPRGEYLASGSNDTTIKLWNVSTRTEVRTYRGHQSPVWSVVFSPDAKHLVSGSWDNTVKLWNLKTGTEIRTLRGHHDKVWSVAFSPDGERIASASDDNTLRVWDTARGTELITMRGGREAVSEQGHKNAFVSVAFSYDGRRILTGDSSGLVRFWESASPQEVEAQQEVKNK